MSAPERYLSTPRSTAVSWGGRYQVWLFNAGLACCAMEFAAAGIGDTGLVDLGVLAFGTHPARADVLVVSGTLTDLMAPAVKRLYDQMPDPKYVISFGACANTGGPYWDSYSVTKGVDQLIPVDVYVPGCPPRPEALRDALATLHQRLAPAD